MKILTLSDNPLLAYCGTNDTGNLILNISLITSTKVELEFAGLYSDSSELASLSVSGMVVASLFVGTPYLLFKQNVNNSANTDLSTGPAVLWVDMTETTQPENT